MEDLFKEGVLTAAEDFFNKPNTPKVEDDLIVIDENWITDVFMVRKNELHPVIKEKAFWSIANLKATDTSPGGNIAINALPQFTRYADIRIKGVRRDRNDVRVWDISGNYGMGRYYAEKIDDNAIRAFLEFGVPEFTGIFKFLLSSVDYKSAVIANTGRSPLPYYAGKIAGSIAMFAAFPIITAVVWVADLLKDVLIGPGNFQYYYLKATPTKYWSIVNSLVIMMSTELGILAPVFNKSSNVIGGPLKFDNEDMEFLRAYLPDIITKENTIDVMALATKTQRMIAKYLSKQYKQLVNENSLSTLEDLLAKAEENLKMDPAPPSKFWEKAAEAMKKTSMYTRKEIKPKEVPVTNTTTDKKQLDQASNSPVKSVKQLAANDDGTYDKNIIDFEQNRKKEVDGLFDFFKATVEEGSRYAVFNVEYLGSSTTSFSNQTAELELQGILNGVAGKARSVKFNMAGAEVIPGLGKLLGYAKDVVVGALDGVTFNIAGKVLTMLTGGANITLPLRWEDSSISLPNHTFRMKLISPYGNPISQLINIYIPLASIMAGALPLATGMSSYTSPFLCSLYVRGYQSIPMGMITSLSITKGTSNLAFNKAMKPLAVDVEFTVTDFSPVIALPVGHDLISSANVIMDDDNPLNRFIQSLCGRDLHTTTYVWPQAKIRLSRLFAEASVITKPSYWGMRLGEVFMNVNGLIPNATKFVDYSEQY